MDWAVFDDRPIGNSPWCGFGANVPDGLQLPGHSADVHDRSILENLPTTLYGILDIRVPKVVALE